MGDLYHVGRDTGPALNVDQAILVDTAGNRVSPSFAGSGYAASGKTAVTGSFTASGSSAVFTPLAGRPFNITLSGTFSATVNLDRSFDGGTTWFPVTYIDGSALSWTAPMSTDMTENETGVSYRLNCTFTSGTVTYRLSQ